MRKRAFLAAAALAAISLPAPAIAQDAVATSDVSAESLQVARDIIAAMYPPETREDTIVEMAQSLGAQIAGSRNLDEIDDEGARRILEEGLVEGLRGLRPIMARHIPKLMDATAIAYADTFTLTELVAIRNFASTPAGAAFFEQSPGLMNHPALTSANGPYFEELHRYAQELQARMLADLEAYFMEQAQGTADPA